MSLVLDENESFSMTANVTSLGYQAIALKGYLMKHEAGKTYITPLLPQMFYGVDGNQLGATWRQNLTQIGEQVILSRSGGEPKVPRQELYWRRVPSKEEVLGAAEEVVGQAVTEALAIPDLKPLLLVGAIFLLLVLGRR